MKTILQKQWSTTARDRLKSLFYAMVVPVLLQIQVLLEKGELHWDLKMLGQVAISAAVAHILRKLLEKDKLITIQNVNKEQLPIAEVVAATANEEKQAPAPLEETEVTINSGNGTPQPGGGPGDVPPPIGDPTHPPKK